MFFNFVFAVLQDERYIRQYREETDKMRNQIKELKTRCEWLVLHGHLHNIHLTVICRRSCSHFVFCFLPEKLLYNIYIIPKRQTAVTSTIGLCQSNPNQSFPLSVCLPVCLSVCPSVLPRICVFSFVWLSTCRFHFSHFRGKMFFKRTYLFWSLHLAPSFITRFKSYSHASHTIFSLT